MNFIITEYLEFKIISLVFKTHTILDVYTNNNFISLRSYKMFNLF